MNGRATKRAMALWDQGARWDEILGSLRAEGFSKVDCVQATIDVLRLPLTDAKLIVHGSRAWADRRKTDEQFHEILGASFRVEGTGG